MIRPGRREALAQHAHERERRLDAMQDAEHMTSNVSASRSTSSASSRR
jgi:hypothetical protein